MISAFTSAPGRSPSPSASVDAQPVWWLVHRLLLENPGVSTLQSIVDAGVDTLLVCGPDDLLPVSLGSEDRVRRMQQTDHFRIVVLDDLDHSSWPLYQRRRMIDVLAEHLVARYRTAPAPRRGAEPVGRRPLREGGHSPDGRWSG